MTDWTRRLALFFVGVAAVCAAGCGGSSTTTKTPPPTSTPPSTTLPATTSTAPPTTPTTIPATSTPQPTEDPIPAAAAQYTAEMEQANGGTCNIALGAQQIPPDTQYSDWVPSSQDLLACLQTFQDLLFHNNLPVSVNAQAGSLAAALQTEISDYQAFIDNPTASTWQDAQNAAAAVRAADAAIRTALHLPPASP